MAQLSIRLKAVLPCLVIAACSTTQPVVQAPPTVTINPEIQTSSPEPTQPASKPKVRPVAQPVSFTEATPQYTQATAQVTPPEPIAMTPPAPVSSPSEISLRGTLVIGHQIQYITPCGSEKKYWLELNEHSRQVYSSLTSAPYQPVYTELSGELNSVDPNLASSGYTLSLQLNDIQYMTTEDRCTIKQDDSGSIEMTGSNPNWSGTITDNELLLEQGFGPQLYQLSGGRFGQGFHEWRSNDNQFKLRIESGECLDEANGRYTNQRVVFHQGVQNLEGCARRPYSTDDQEFVGFFNARLPTTGEHYDLAVKADHSANLRYIPSEGQIQDLPGYWYSTDDKQFTLVLSPQAGFPNHIPKQQTFNWDGFDLTLLTPGSRSLKYARMSGPAQITPEKIISPTRQLAPQTLRASAAYDAAVDTSILRYFHLHRSTPSGRYLWWKFDLNGDGREEILALMNWCSGSACTLLIFEPSNVGYRYVSRSTQIRLPMHIGEDLNHEWHQILLPAGASRTEQYVTLEFDGMSYPLTPPTLSKSGPEPGSSVTLTADLTGQWGRPVTP